MSTLDPKIARTALRIKHVLDARTDEMFASYEREVASHHAEGHSPSHCIHGTYLWTEYDPICGPCEDGFTRREDFALENYAEAISQARAMFQALGTLREMNRLAGTLNLPTEAFNFDAALDALLVRFHI